MMREGVSRPHPSLQGRPSVVGTAQRTATRLAIGGIQKQSLIDYPGKLSCVVFLSGCNLACPYCHNPELARGEVPAGQAWDWNELRAFLVQRRGFLDGVVISGGEPTLQEGLPQLCALIRELGYPVKLDTNGSRPRMLQRLIDGKLVDYIAMDIKTNPFAYGRLAEKTCEAAPILTSIGLITASAVDYEFRTTCVRPLVTACTIDTISRLIQGARRYVLQAVRGTTVLHPEYFRDGRPHAFSARAMARLHSIAAPRVADCLVR